MLQDGPQQLVCQYLGNDKDGRLFDILIDGVKVATQKLDTNAPGKFFTVANDLNPEMVARKTHAVVRFQSHPGYYAGGVYHCAIVTRK
jgi:hypothetical protein